jgi:hypothetical protein
MKSDLSRETFDHLKHYSSVRMQQGRVQVDADWNEQAGITLYRIEREAADLIGGCGGPIHNAGFEIKKSTTAGGVSTVTDTATARQSIVIGLDPIVIGLDPIDPITIPPNDFLLTKGRYYVDGILCEIDSQTLFSKQPDLPHRPEVLAIPVDSLGNRFLSYLAYLDVWRRNITALDDPKLREVALGGPDTSTRKKTIWQVKLAPVTHNNCIDAFAELKKQKQPSSGQMSARTAPGAATTDPCIVPSTAGFRGLENQFYRIEIHNPGTGFDISTAGGGKAISLTSDPTKIKVTGFKAGQAVELFLTGPSADTTFRKLFYVVGVDSVGGTITLNSSLSGVRQQDAPQIRAVGATFKWSRDNGSVVTLITKIDKNDPRVLTVLNVGNDRVTGFAPDQWVELIDDTLELNGLPGQLLQIAEVDQARQLITLKSPAAPLSLTSLPSDGVDPAFHPKLRRWDGVGAVDVSSTGFWIGIESGIQVSFAAGSYQNGDYWTIPARTATADAESGNIEWPQDANKVPLSLSPFGIDHHYCPLAMLDSTLSPTSDCRRLFPPVTELTTLYFVDGDGQEAMPGRQLPKSLQVRVANGQNPVEKTRVKFSIVGGSGTLSGTGNAGGIPAGGTPPTSLIVTTEAANGMAECSWTLDATTESQQVEAVLLDAKDNAIPGQVVRFNANLSVAAQVAYDPKQCGSLLGQNTVQAAIERLSSLVSLYRVSGDGQLGPPNEPLAEPLVVAASSKCGSVDGIRVVFTVVSGGGKVNNAPTVTVVTATGSDGQKGHAACTWTLGPSLSPQVVEAVLQSDAANPTAPPTTVRFTARQAPGFHINRVFHLAAPPPIFDAQTATGTSPASGDRLATPAPVSPIVPTPLEFRNDTEITLAELLNGIGIECNKAVNPSDINRATCFVTLELPFPLNRADLDQLGNLVAGFQPLILAANVAAADAQITWKAKPETATFLTKLLTALTGRGDRLLFHLTLKGNFIQEQGNADSYLDGQVFGIHRVILPQGTGLQVDKALPSIGLQPIDPIVDPTIDIRLPSGDLVRGGDFEMWFWVKLPVPPPQPPLQVNRVAFIFSGAGINEATLLTLTLPPIPAQPVPVPVPPLGPPVNTIDIAFNRLLIPAGLVSSNVKLEQLAPNAPAKTLTVSVAKTTETVWRLSLTGPIGPAGPPTLVTGGQYRLTISKAVMASDNTLLDGTFTNEPGKNDFQLLFTISGGTTVVGLPGGLPGLIQGGTKA